MVKDPQFIHVMPYALKMVKYLKLGELALISLVA